MTDATVTTTATTPVVTAVTSVVGDVTKTVTAVTADVTKTADTAVSDVKATVATTTKETTTFLTSLKSLWTGTPVIVKVIAAVAVAVAAYFVHKV